MPLSQSTEATPAFPSLRIQALRRVRTLNLTDTSSQGWVLLCFVALMLSSYLPGVIWQNYQREGLTI
jgi:hypothetical protein